MSLPTASLLVRGAAQVVTCAGDGPSELGVVERGAVLVREGRVAWVGPEAELPAGLARADPDLAELDAAGGCVLPGFVDAHTHLVFAGDRADEHRARLSGEPYRTGGIMTTVAATRAASDAELVADTLGRAEACLAQGTTTLEAKSGYGLDTGTERRLREVAGRTRARIVPTFLGAHLLPEPGYLDLLVEEMLPACAPLAEGCDAFCDVGALSVEEARKALEAGRAHGLTPRLHAEELAHSGGALLAAELGCASADHLVHATEEDARALAATGVVAVLLPATSFCLRSDYAPARLLLDHGVEVALATDCNPGTSYTTSMPFVVALACAELRLSAEEAVRAATRGGAAALGRPDLGRLTPGACGDLVVLAGGHYIDLAYHPGMDRVAAVVAGGEVVRGGRP
jgi:imidazolonepropionase